MSNNFSSHAKSYMHALQESFSDEILSKIEILAKDLMQAWQEGRQVFICGNGGSAANAIHIANDLIYGIGVINDDQRFSGIKVEAPTSNQGVLTCLANDTGYENNYSIQLVVKAKAKIS